MRFSGTKSVLTAAVAVVAALGMAQATAFAAPSLTPTVSISAKSAFPKVTGDVFVVFLDGASSNAHIKGSVTGGTSGQVLQLFARQFPFKNPATALGSPVTLSSSSTPYSFTVTPTLATRYVVKLFTDSSMTTLVAKSATQVVYVVAHGRAGGVRTCNRPGQRPVCHQRIHLTVTVPPSTLRTERPKLWHLYFGLTLNRAGPQPAPPRRLRLGGGNAKVVSTSKVSNQEYAATFTFSFRIGNAGYDFVINACQKDTESTDGLNLPGHHGCGDSVISSRLRYLG